MNYVSFKETDFTKDQINKIIVKLRNHGGGLIVLIENGHFKYYLRSKYYLSDDQFRINKFNGINENPKIFKKLEYAKNKINEINNNSDMFIASLGFWIPSVLNILNLVN